MMSRTAPTCGLQGGWVVVPSTEMGTTRDDRIWSGREEWDSMSHSKHYPPPPFLFSAVTPCRSPASYFPNSNMATWII